jgi:hypothetical protein
MVKVGNRVSLFHNIGKEGTVIKLTPVRVNTSFTGGTSSNSWRIHIQWDDGTTSAEKLSDVMRID